MSDAGLKMEPPAEGPEDREVPKGEPPAASPDADAPNGELLPNADGCADEKARKEEAGAEDP